MPKSMFDIIKKQNGEGFAKAIRSYDNGIFDIPNLDKIVKYAGRDAVPIMAFLISLKGITIREMSVHRSPLDLLSAAGYNAYVADTLTKQNAIQKYFARGEELCTFRDPHRFENYYIINAVRKDVDKIKRGNPPKREDEYGTSVISIQVLKRGGFISIKNRYNHTVDSPDNTFNSDPDRIIPGLADAIRHYFNVDFSSQQVELPNKYVFINHQIIHYNQERNNIYFGDDFYVQDGIVHELDNNTELMLGNGLIYNNHTKQVRALYRVTVKFGEDTQDVLMFDDFLESLNALFRDKKTRIESTKDGTKSIFADGTKVLETKHGMLTYINAPTAPYLRLDNMTLNGDLDFSGVRDISLDYAKFAPGSSVKLNPNAHSISLNETTGLSGDLDFRNVTFLSLGNGYTLDCRYIQSVKFPKHMQAVNLVNVQMHGDLDLGMISRVLVLQPCDLSNTNLIVNPNCHVVEITGTTGLHGVLNLEHVDELYLINSDVSKLAELKTNPNAESVRFTSVKGLHGNFDFGHVQNISLEDTDFDACPNIKLNPTANYINLYKCKNLRGAIDLSNVKNATISDSDFSKASLLKVHHSFGGHLRDSVGPMGVLDLSAMTRGLVDANNIDLSHTTNLLMPRRVNEVRFNNARMPACDFNALFGDGSNNFLWCEEADFSKTKNINIQGKIKNCSLMNATGLHGDLDFSNVLTLNLGGADLSRVHSIKFNPNGRVVGLRAKDKLRFAAVNGMDKLKKLFGKQDKAQGGRDDQRTM